MGWTWRDVPQAHEEELNCILFFGPGFSGMVQTHPLPCFNLCRENSGEYDVANDVAKEERLEFSIFIQIISMTWVKDTKLNGDLTLCRARKCYLLLRSWFELHVVAVVVLCPINLIYLYMKLGLGLVLIP
jgi:hypothetical protein